METVSFGNTGLKVSRLGFGAVTSDSSWLPDEAAARSVLGRCLDLGITLFDATSRDPTRESERIMASTLISMAPRDTLVLATKVMNGDHSGRGLSRRHLQDSVEASLRRMKTDYIDLLVVHAFDPETPIEETMAALHDLVRSGKVRYLGASTMFAWQLAQTNHAARLNGWTQFVNMQCEYNLLYREEERELLPFCRHQGIAVTASHVLARGQLSGSRAPIHAHSGHMYGDVLDREICTRVDAIARAHDTTMAAIAIAWVLSRDDICCPIIGAATADEVTENVEALDLVLTADEIADLTALYRPRDVINRPEPMPRYWQEDSDE